MSVDYLPDIHRKVDRFVRAYQDKEFEAYNPQITAEIAAYFCVLLYGYYQITLQGMLLDYAVQKGPPEFAHFVEQRVSRPSVSPSDLKGLLGNFSPEWKKSMKEKMEERSDCEDALVSLVSQRHLIAHGRCVSLSMVDLCQWKEQADEVMDWIRDLLELPVPGKSKN